MTNELLNFEMSNITTADMAIIIPIISFIFGLFIGFLIFKSLHVKSINRKNQMTIKDLEDERTNLEGQIRYIELKNKTLVEEVDEKVLYFANENQILLDKNSELQAQLKELETSNNILIAELQEEIDKAVKDKKTLFKQIEETIIFE
ncbi:hypothetical protein [Sulfurimonas sp.]|uniref:hypothetical protein n=1 Tax=Sulfurimonas sp. TaxID=2022749 RepID=UPI00262CF9E3|nr:hypothetical protein [Sulfurimonas sp.]MCW8895939.1 hypothetical protein [Sulfurimonas sp.]MCW9067420.1 hypothetical protein [Sulfurimonas sp.]